jgi:phage/plasmid-associated DNA primase
VTAATEQYKRMSDHFQTFVEKFIEMDSDSSIVIDDLFEIYKDFMMDQNKGARVKRQDFILNIKTVLRFEGNDYDTGYGGKIKKVVSKEPGFVTD